MDGINSLPPRKIKEVVKELGLEWDEVFPYGHYIAKIPVQHLFQRATQKDGLLVLVTAMTPTPQGEGKTTTTIGLGDAFRRLGYKTVICLREPSLGPYFGIKGGGTGAGQAQVVPSEDINLHFTGDMYAVTKANNLLAALVDNHIHHGNELGIDPRRIVLRRVMDLNDRALREIFIGLGGVRNGVPRKDGFDITPASEVMAILCLAQSFTELGDRLGRMIVGYTFKGKPVTAADLRAVGAMQVLLRDAIHPNLVQTLEGTPAFVHGGPFANVAQGTNSVISTKMALKLADVVVTEAGFGTDLGAEKFFHIKCRLAALKPLGVVIVATVKAVKYHGGFDTAGGLGNLGRHIDNIRCFGLEPVVAVNRFVEDSAEEIEQIIRFCNQRGVQAVVSEAYFKGGEGAIALARAVLESAKENRRRKLRFLYELDEPVLKKLTKLARKLYGASGVELQHEAETQLQLIERHGFGELPLCVAKTSASLSDDPNKRGVPCGFKLTVNEFRVAAGAGFIIPICGSIVTMPGLPKEPVAVRIKVLADGRAVGLA